MNCSHVLYIEIHYFLLQERQIEGTSKGKFKLKYIDPFSVYLVTFNNIQMQLYLL